MLLDQKEANRLLSKYKIPFTKCEMHHSRKKALKTKIEFPLVVKAMSDTLVHKSDAGAVMTGINSKGDLLQALTKLGALKKEHPDLHYMLQKQEIGKEIIIGMKRDEQFGPVILFGMGGVFVEVFKDVSFRIAPLTSKDIKEMVQGVKAYKILKGVRGEKAVNIVALEGILQKVSKLAIKEKDIQEIDFNPVMVNDKYATVVDVRILK